MPDHVAGPARKLFRQHGRTGTSPEVRELTTDWVTCKIANWLTIHAIRELRTITEHGKGADAFLSRAAKSAVPRERCSLLLPASVWVAKHRQSCDSALGLTG